MSYCFVRPGIFSFDVISDLTGGIKSDGRASFIRDASGLNIANAN